MKDTQNFLEWITSPRYILFHAGIVGMYAGIIMSQSGLYYVGLFWMIFGSGQMCYDVCVGFKNTKKLPDIEVVIVEPLKYYKNYGDALANRKRNGVIWYKSGKGYYIMYHSENILESQRQFFREPQ